MGRSGAFVRRGGMSCAGVSLKGDRVFCDLENFNFSLLAKQGWRILQTLDSVLSTCLKAKYYPHSDVMTASLCQRPSYTWRSIWEARGLLEERVRWGVGDGS